MEAGIFSRTYEISDLEETCRRMTAHGIFRTQFNFSNAGLPTLPESIGEEKLEEIGRTVRKYGIRIDALTGTFNMIDPDEEARARGCRQFAVQCRAAHALGIPIVSLCTGSKNRESKWKWHEDNRTQAAWDDLMRTTEQLLRCAEESDVVLGVETEASNVICTPQLARKYLDKTGSPRLKIIMDGANLFRPGEERSVREVLDEAFAVLGKDIVLAHAKDFVRGQELSFVAAGEGELDFAYYTERLKKCGYDGALMMHGLSEEQVPRSKRFLDRVLS